MQRAGGASTLSAAATFGTYLNAKAKDTLDSARTPPAPPTAAATNLAATHLMLTGKTYTQAHVCVQVQRKALHVARARARSR